MALFSHARGDDKTQESLRSGVRPYSRAPIIGAACCILLVLCSIILSSHSLLPFFSLEGLMIVVGGVIAVAFMSFQADDVRKALNAILQMFREPEMTHENLHRDMIEIIDWARVVREKGMRDLESQIGKNGEGDPFVKYGLNMVVSQYTPKEVRSMMTTAANACYERDSVPVGVLQAMTSHAPAFGMVGTLVGMVTMLCSLSDNVSSIGPSLAVSFLSTLYGVLSARMLYMPAASKLRQEVDNRRFRNHLITEGLVMLVSDKTPMYIQDHLNSFLRPDVHDYFNVDVKNSPLPLPLNHRFDMKIVRPAKPRLRAVGA
jgi:chemotaxis protein MotA